MSKYVSDLVRELSLNTDNIIVKSSIDRIIEKPQINQIGLELVGFKEFIDSKQIIVLSEKELSYLSTMDEQEIITCFNYLIKEETPCLIVTEEIPKFLVMLAIEKDISIIRYPETIANLLMKIYSLFEKWFAPKQLVLGTLLQINGLGVLLKGASGIGKSAIALELIKRGHLFISDDSIEVISYDNYLEGRAPIMIKNMIEIRGLGLLDVAQLFGYCSIIEESKIDYIIELIDDQKQSDSSRIINENTQESILGIRVKKLILPVSESHNMADVIEVACTNFKLQQQGININEQYVQKVEAQLKEENDVY